MQVFGGHEILRRERRNRMRRKEEKQRKCVLKGKLDKKHTSSGPLFLYGLFG
jgi:hypothetical protein